MRFPAVYKAALSYASKLRSQATDAELKTFKRLSHLNPEFQKIILTDSGHFHVVDFYFPQYHVYLELDGKHHYTTEGKTKDIARAAELTKMGFGGEVRYSNSEILSAHITHIQQSLNRKRAYFTKEQLDIPVIDIVKNFNP